MKYHLLTFAAFIAVFSLLPLHVAAQTRSIDQMFETYSADDHFTYVNISGQMLQLISGQSDLHHHRNEGGPGIISRLNRIRILTSSDLRDESVTQAFRELKENLVSQDYAELMEIRDAGSHFRFLIKGEADLVEQLVLVGHDTDNHVLISIEGSLTLSELRRVSDIVPGLEGLRRIEVPRN